MESRKWWLSEARGDGGWEKWEGAGKRVQTFSYRMNEFEDIMYNMVTVVDNIVLY